MFVVFDGLDGVGKTTIAKKIAEETGFVYMPSMTYHDRTLIKNAVIQQKDLTTLHEISIDVLRERSAEISRILKTDKSVILDRYIYSCISYYYALSEISKSPVQKIDYENYHFLKPDICIFLTASASVIKQRLYEHRMDKINTTDQLSFNNVLFRKRVQEYFYSFAEGLNAFFVQNNGNMDSTIKKVLSIINHQNTP